MKNKLRRRYFRRMAMKKWAHLTATMDCRLWQ